MRLQGLCWMRNNTSPTPRLPFPQTVYLFHRVYKSEKSKKQLPAIITYDSQLIFHYINT